jgi:hypothetical protein
MLELCDYCNGEKMQHNNRTATLQTLCQCTCHEEPRQQLFRCFQYCHEKLPTTIVSLFPVKHLSREATDNSCSDVFPGTQETLLSREAIDNSCSAVSSICTCHDKLQTTAVPMCFQEHKEHACHEKLSTIAVSLFPVNALVMRSYQQQLFRCVSSNALLTRSYRQQLFRCFQ